MVGLLPLCAATVFEPELCDEVPGHRPSASSGSSTHAPSCAPPSTTRSSPASTGGGSSRSSTSAKLRRVLAKMLDENEFLSAYGIRSLSRYHETHPYVLHVGGQEYRVGYLPAESDTGMFGGNSNWRGPIWMPVNVLIIRALLQLLRLLRRRLHVECPTGSGGMMNLYQVAEEIGDRLHAASSCKDEDGHRPVYGGTEMFQNDPHWRDHILFYEYFHGDNGAGLGASHQTGWTGIVARADAPVRDHHFDAASRARPEGDQGRDGVGLGEPAGEHGALTARGRTRAGISDSFSRTTGRGKEHVTISQISLRIRARGVRLRVARASRPRFRLRKRGRDARATRRAYAAVPSERPAIRAHPMTDLERLQRLIDARHPCVAVETVEEDYVLKLLAHACVEAGREMHCWSVTRGVYDGLVAGSRPCRTRSTPRRRWRTCATAGRQGRSS